MQAPHLLFELNSQAAVIADSPFYKLLIGRMLGYKEENILQHIKVSLKKSMHWNMPKANIECFITLSLAKDSNLWACSVE